MSLRPRTQGHGAAENRLKIQGEINQTRVLFKVSNEVSKAVSRPEQDHP